MIKPTRVPPFIQIAFFQDVSVFSQMGNNKNASNTYLAFIHPNPDNKLEGFYMFSTYQCPNIWCPCPEPPTGLLQFSYSFQISHNLLLHKQVDRVSSEDLAVAKQTYQDFCLDQKCQKLNKCSYECYITNIIHELIQVNDTKNHQSKMYSDS